MCLSTALDIGPSGDRFPVVNPRPALEVFPVPDSIFMVCPAIGASAPSKAVLWWTASILPIFLLWRLSLGDMSSSSPILDGPPSTHFGAIPPKSIGRVVPASSRAAPASSVQCSFREALVRSQAKASRFPDLKPSSFHDRASAAGTTIVRARSS